MSSSSTILDVGGAVAHRLPGYEQRPEQVEMASAIERAFRDSRHLLVEAGTGVGKSFAYLIPAIQQATNDGERVLVSTHTIALQEQLIERDIPFLQAVWPDEFTAVLVKGRHNYLSIRRLVEASERQNLLFARSEHLQELYRIEDWAYKTTDGSLADLSPLPDPAVWELARSEHDNCMGRSCPQYAKCFYHSARRRAERAQILIVNHALMLSDLALRRQGAGVLPDYQLAVIDEAHAFEAVASEHFGRSVSQGQVRHLLNRLHNDRTGRGFLAAVHADAAAQTVEHTRRVARTFWRAVTDWYAGTANPTGRVKTAIGVPNELSDALRELRRDLRRVRASLTKEEEVVTLTSLTDRAGTLADEIDLLIAEPPADQVRWIEQTQSAHLAHPQIRICQAPTLVADALRETLFTKVRSVVLTSATLATRVDRHHASVKNAPSPPGARPASRGQSEDAAPPKTGFTYIRARLGIDEADELQLGSPFNYREQVELHVEMGLPDPDSAALFLPAAADAIERHVTETQGRALVLFTSYEMIGEMARVLRPRLEAAGLRLLVQGEGMPRSLMLER
ncbi:MAG: DEAD/DEAH box helicase, partial [Planctomycetes bacterium]|nr:DEAD/DEAH box helicase [Planctomycetota bacterium]